MSRHDDGVRVRHMLDHAREAIVICAARTRAELDSDRLFNLALVRLVEIIGEAGTKISGGLRERYPEVPWREIIAMRNRIIHGYDAVDFDILWAVVTVDLPPLVTQLETILAEL